MTISNKISAAFKAGFEKRCITLFIAAYQSIIKKKIIKLDWDENDITSELHKYMSSSHQRSKWSIFTDVEHHLPKDNIKKEKGFAAKYPRIDLNFASFNSHVEYKYSIEAKKLIQNDSDLKRRYIKTGIDNFISKKYQNGCLVGYLLYGTVELTINGINSLLVKYGRSSEILCLKTCMLHDNYYESSHTAIGTLKHYILDFTEL